MRKKAIEIQSREEISKYEKETLILYYTRFEDTAAEFGIMPDEKAGIRRTAYHGVVSIRQGSNYLLLAPRK